MKQSHNALSMLLRAYRSVFKNAYLKGLAGAVILTTTCATANAAYAQESTPALSTLDNIQVTEANNMTEIRQAQIAVLSKGAVLIESGEQTYHLQDNKFHFANGLLINDNASLTITLDPDTKTAGEQNLFVMQGRDQAFVVEGALNLKGDADHNVQIIGARHIDSEDAEAQYHEYDGHVIMDTQMIFADGQLNAEHATLSATEIKFDSADIILKGNRTNVYAYGTAYDYNEHKIQDAFLEGRYVDNDSVNGELKAYQDADISITNSKLTIEGNGVIGALDGMVIDTSEVVLNGAGKSVEKPGNENAIIQASLRQDGEALKISSSSVTSQGSDIIAANKLAFTDTALSVNKGANLALQGVNVDSKNADLKTELNVSGGSVKVVGDLTVKGKATIDTELTNSGKITFTSGDSTLTDANGLSAHTGTIVIDKEARLTLEGNNSANQGKFETKGTLALGEGAVLSVKSLSDVGVEGTSAEPAPELLVAEASGNVRLGKNSVLNVDGPVTITAGMTGLTGEEGSSLKSSDITFDYAAATTLTAPDVVFDADKLTLKTTAADETLTFAATVRTDSLVSEKNVNIIGDKASLIFEGTAGSFDKVLGAGSAETAGTLSVAAGKYEFAEVNVEAKGSMDVAKDAEASVGKFTAYGEKSVTVAGSLAINGADKAEKAADVGVDTADGAIAVANTGTLTYGSNVADNYIEFAVAQEPAEKGDSPASLVTVNENLGKIAGSVGSTVNLDLSDEELEISTEAFGELKSKLFTEGTSEGVNINLGKAQLANVTVGENNEVKLEDLQNSAAANGATTDELQKATVTSSSNEFTTGTSSVGSVRVTTSDTDAVVMKGNWTLNASAANTSGKDGFVTNNDGTVLDIEFTGNNLTLANGGNAGAITVKDAAGAVVSTKDTAGGAVIRTGSIDNSQGTVQIAGNTAVTGTIKADTLDVSSSLTNTQGAGTGNAAIIAGTLKTQAGAKVTASSITLGNKDAAADSESVIAGGSVTADSITLQAHAEGSASVQLSNSAVVNVDKFVGAANTAVYTGSDGEQGSAATLVVGAVNVNGTLFVADPAFGKDYSLQVFEHIDSTPDTAGDDFIVNKGGFVAGQNSVTAVGMTEEQARATAALYTKNGSFSADSIGAMMMVGHKLTLDGASLVVSTAEQAEAEALATANTVYLGNKTALWFSQDAATGEDAAVTFTSADGKVVADGGQIIVGGNISADSKLNLFDYADSVIGAGAVKVEGTANNANGVIKISTENGLLSAVFDPTAEGADLSNIQLELNGEPTKVLTGMSDPLYKAAMAIYSDSSLQGDGVSYVRSVFGKSDGHELEATARMAMAGGVLQGTYLVGESTTDLIAERNGIARTQSGLIASDNAQGAAVWLAPVYRYQSADGFDADGLDFGADVDFAGVALGADYKFQNCTFGAMFNIGTGSADGNGFGSAVDNDFDYWSIAAYAGVEFSGLKVLGDISYTATDNDLDQSTGIKGFEKMSASTDADLFSLGVSAQYKIETMYVDITPHAGLRYSRLDMDDYTVKSSGKAIADIDGEAQNVFSVPVGVTFTKDLSLGQWSVAPVFDVTLAGNFGDTDADSSVKFSGADFSTGLNAEFMDEFTYSTSVGVSASKGGFSLGLGVSYVGSENTDAFGVGGNVRYTF